MPPKVEDLATILAQYEPAYAQSRNLYNQQLNVIPGQTNAAKQGLETAKGNAFRDINTNANSKGLAFSGIPTSEQTRYTGEKYLPALANLESQSQTQMFTLQQALASLEADKYKTALGRQSEQQKTLDAYLEAERDRQFRAQEAEKERVAADRRAAADRSASATPQRSNVELFAEGLANVAGRDGKVSPGDYNAAKNQWVASGYGDYKSFHDKFWRFANDKYWWDYR